MKILKRYFYKEDKILINKLKDIDAIADDEKKKEELLKVIKFWHKKTKKDSEDIGNKFIIATFITSFLLFSGWAIFGALLLGCVLTGNIINFYERINYDEFKKLLQINLPDYYMDAYFEINNYIDNYKDVKKELTNKKLK